MSGRSNLIIFFIGIAGLGSMGIMVKLAFDFDPNLSRIGKVKKAFADGYNDQGLSDFSIQTLPKKMGYKVKAAVEGAAEDDYPTLAEQVAQSFIMNFDGAPRSRLKVEFVQSVSGLSCEGPKSLFEGEFRVSELKRWKRLKEVSNLLVDKVHPQLGLQITQAEPRGATSLTLVLIPNTAGEEVPPMTSEQRELLKSFIFKTMGRAPVRTVHLVLRSSLEENVNVKEFELERSKPKTHTRQRWLRPPPQKNKPTPQSSSK